MVECTWWSRGWELWWVGVTEGGGEAQGLGHTHKHKLQLQLPPNPWREMNRGKGWGAFGDICFHAYTLTRLNGKDQWQIGIGRADSGSGGWGPQKGFVPMWEFVAVHAFIMKLNEARKCLVGHGQNTEPLMFPWQFWHERESVLVRKVSDSNAARCDFYFTICKQFLACAVKLLQGVSDESS